MLVMVEACELAIAAAALAIQRTIPELKNLMQVATDPSRSGREKEMARGRLAMSKVRKILEVHPGEGRSSRLIALQVPDVVYRRFWSASRPRGCADPGP